MDLSQRRHAWLRRLALLTAALVLAITSLSAYIRLSHVGLGCSEWPQCYGSRMRAAQQNDLPAVADSVGVTVARVVHRLIAVLALLLIVSMGAVCFGNSPWLLREGVLVLALLALAIGLAVLGRWTAGSRMPAVVIGNLLGGVLMLALSWRLAAGAIKPARPVLRALAWVGVVVLFVQIALGALVSASYAGLSCIGPGDCLQAAEAAGWPWQTLNPWREPTINATTTPVNPSGALLQLLHRAGSLLVLFVLTALGMAALCGQRRREGIILLALLVLQLGLGFMMVASSLPLAVALAHNVLAGLLFASTMRLT